jgi:PAS domain S-box-containing protein
MPTDEPAQESPRSAELTAEELAAGLADQRRRVDAMAGPDSVASPDLSTVLGEIDIAHEELRVAEEELRSQQRRLDELLAERSDPRAWRRGLISTLPVPALVSDLAGLVLEVNAAAWALLGRRRDEILERPLRDLVPDEQQERVDAALAAVAASDGTQHVELALLAADGTAVPVDMVAGSDSPRTPGALVTWVAGNGRSGATDPVTGLRTAEAFAEMCRLPLQSGADTRSVLARAALLVEKAIPTSDGVSITLGPPGEPEAQATDNVFAQAVDGAQLQAGEGPCLDAYTTGHVMVCEDLGADPRWEKLAELARPLGVAAVLGCPIRTDRHSLGVLNIYARRTDAFDERDRHVADLLVSAVLAVVQETRDRHELTQLSTQLREALESRAVIDQAKGILMGRGRRSADQAFAQLVAASRRSNIKVRDVARLVVEEVTGDGGPRAPGPHPDGGPDGEGHGPR